MAEVKNAKRVYKLDEIKFNEKNKAMAVVSWIPIVGLIMLFVEKEDLFVRYVGAQSTLLGLLLFIGIVPIIGWILSPIVGLLVTILAIVGIIKTLQAERFDVPVLSEWALKLMGAI